MAVNFAHFSGFFPQIKSQNKSPGNLFVFCYQRVQKFSQLKNSNPGFNPGDSKCAKSPKAKTSAFV